MRSIIFIHKDEKISLENAVTFAKKQAIHDLDLSIFNTSPESDLKKTTGSTSIGIDTIKKLKQAIFLKPLKGTQKAVILPKAHLLTIPAQNAFLKLLEEPPASTYLILTTQSEDSLLPTILSRCSIIKLHQEELIVEDEKKAIYRKEFYALSSLPLATLLKRAEQLAKNKPEAEQYLIIMVSVVREELLINATKGETPSHQHLTFLQNLSESYRLIQQTNTNLRLVLENLFLSLRT